MLKNFRKFQKILNAEKFRNFWVSKQTFGGGNFQVFYVKSFARSE